MNNKPLILLVGKSGSGKTTIAEYLEKHYGMKMLRSYTTRPMRKPNEDGHIFVTKDDFNAMPHKVAHTFFDNHDYWATQEQCDASDVYVIDPDGVKSLKRNYLSTRPYYTIYLQVNPFVRLWRMYKRDKSIAKSLKRIVHDHNKFGHFEPHFYVKRDTVANMAHQIYDWWCDA